MIASSPLMKAAALSVALAAHAGLAVVVMGAPPGAQVAGRAEGVDLRLGASFADLASGRLVPVEVALPVDTPAPEPSRPVPPAPLAESRAAPAASPSSQAAVPVAARSARADSAQAMVAAIPPQTTGAAAVTALRAQQAAPRLAAVAAPDGHVAGQDAGGSAPEASPRPRPRHAAPEPRAAAPARAGNADRDARAGHVAGRDAGAARSSGAGRAAQEAGNAAASTYPGAVMARLSRVRRPSVGVRATVTVSFTVAPGGQLAALGVTASSGSAALDSAALTLVRRAAPFPPPPAGARRVFSIDISGR